MPKFELNPKALAAWNPHIKVAAEQSVNTITMFGVVGDSYDYWGETNKGITLARVDAALRSIGDNEVVVYINSPGGDMFEGIAIYNRLREHSQKVTIKVIGLAASAASIIAMAGAERLIAKSAFLMIHNCWSNFVGNRNDLRDIADQLEEFDISMRDVYIDVSGMSESEVTDLMDKESYLSGSSAVQKSLMTGVLQAEEIATDTAPASQAQAFQNINAALAEGGVPYNQRLKMLAAIKDNFWGQESEISLHPTTKQKSSNAAAELFMSFSDGLKSLAF
ncbi:hypothetical protein AKN87_01815 [Thiopseudomonas alkaliphila]|uniref:ATP-dependent Clp protease proteolytic subunit n=1 Tax=Thiopseudomonas alkaliphila TaxID=1697053 RepID=A0A0K1XH12_9GAMM|nr:head maturation protease, ClpP-related [Thiopseudomonas alkaliphila]AKX43984.1 hypothetical protein AKN87_01815 [Thiopseudomonas alkaliphila]AKX52029.1 hypothetical protein AKN92_11500 [Thiopseudomonas alkaliphila]AKX60468.1 hypothetical protein AKN88_11425 [Thiopseudomonas alkaliphila]